MENPVLFLDFDGVLRPVSQATARASTTALEYYEILDWLHVLDDILEPFPEVRIVVSSDRRCGFRNEELVSVLGPLGARFVGIVESYHESSREEEIRAEVERRGIKDWLAVDDHSSIVTAAKEEPRFIPCQTW